jgi:hypothetical protein
MKELDNYFIGRGEVKGFSFSQLDSNSKAYLYEVNTGYSVHYEVFERKENTRFNCVTYPNSNSFGKFAWCITDKDEALERFSKL